MTSTPLVTIGLPVYNGRRFVEAAIESLLAQESVDFELVISDNGSDDGTEEICRAAADTDPRVRFLRSEENRGAAWNYNRLVDAASGQYFKWAAHDDLYAPTFLTRCVEVLEAEPTVSLCYSRAVDIDEAGTIIYEYPAFPYADDAQPWQRARAVLRNPTPCFESFGLTRRNQLLQTGRIGGYTSSDRTLMFELAIQGRFHELPETLFFHRQHPGRSVHRFRGARQRDAWFDPSRAGVFTLPRWRLVAEHAKAVRRAPVSTPQCLRTAATLPSWAARSMVPLARELGGWAAHQFGAGPHRTTGSLNAMPHHPGEPTI